MGLLTTSTLAFSRFYIGSGSAAPTDSNTQMETLLAVTQTAQGADIGVNGVAPNYEVSTTKTKRFIAGVGTGTVREVGCGINDTSVAGLTVRQLVSPAIVKGATQVLDLIWRFTLWPPLGDLAGTVTIDGILYDTIVRGCNYAYSAPAQRCMDQFGPASIAGSNHGSASDVLGALNAAIPTGTLTSGGESITWLAGGQFPGVGYREYDFKLGLNQGNLVGGTKTIWSQTNQYHKIQCQFSSKVPKDATKEWTPRFRIEWSRH
jgi:hypothetical protein